MEGRATCFAAYWLDCRRLAPIPGLRRPIGQPPRTAAKTMSDPAINHNQPHGLRQLFSWRNGVAWGMLAFTLLVQLVVWQSLRTNEDRARSEEHTSELQSLMRTSYAVI